MALVYKDRVKQTVDAPSGSAAFDFDSNGATPTGYQSFVDALADTNTCIYAAEDTGGNWEVGVGTWAEADKTLTRTTILASSNSGSAESFSGTVTVYITNSAKAEELSAVFGLSEVSVTTTATATIGNMHVCSGTSADYTVTLPAASGNAGRLIGFRMSDALTKLVTIDGNASETIDGATTRIMWAEESAILLCDGSNWFKIAGKTIPIFCKISRTSASADQAFSSATWTACALVTFDSGYAGMHDTTNNRAKIVRPGTYVATASVYCTGTNFNSYAYCCATRNATANSDGLQTITVTATVAAGTHTGIWVCAVNDYFNCSAFIDGTSPVFDTIVSQLLSVVEVPEW